MLILGYLVTDRKYKDIDRFVEQVNDISLADPTKPILIVGWDKAKESPLYKSILDKQLDKNLFWTFSKSESRSDFESDLEEFYSYIYNNKLDKISYHYVNIFKLRYNKIKKFYDILNSSELKTIYISNGIAYIPYKGNILGLSITIAEYCGIKQEKIISILKRNKNNKIIDDNNIFAFRLSRKLGNKKYALPYFITS